MPAPRREVIPRSLPERLPRPDPRLLDPSVGEAMTQAEQAIRVLMRHAVNGNTAAVLALHQLHHLIERRAWESVAIALRTGIDANKLAARLHLTPRQVAARYGRAAQARRAAAEHDSRDEWRRRGWLL